MTILPVPSRRADNLVLILCDQCKKDIQVSAGVKLPKPWREVKMNGWIGVMHACSDHCEIGVRVRHEKKESPCE